MRFAIISDIHGNIEAFNRVLDDIASQNVQGCYFLGDAISYGPEPELCLQKLRDNKIFCVLGNHELAIVQPKFRSYFNPPTRDHFDQARHLLSKDSIKYIFTWPKTRQEHDMLMVHGCPPGSVTRYLYDVNEQSLFRILTCMKPTMAFVGHTHELEMVNLNSSGISRNNISRGVYSIEGGKVIINAGSVGQPRDGDNSAKYVIWDKEKRVIEVRYVEYDIEKTVKGIQDRGFPEFYAHRLR